MNRIADLTEIRSRRPEVVNDAWASRRRRPLLGEDGRLLIVAADHAARAALAVGDNALAMGDRSDALERIAVALERPGVDGVLATADVLEDLLLMGALEDKVVIGSMNRGGLRGSQFEFDDRMTGYTADGIADRGLDGGKMLTRICLDDPATVRTLEAAGHAVSQLADRHRMAMIEPFVSVRESGGVRNLDDAESAITSIHVAAGLGTTSAYTWLKLPVVDDLERVMAATTMPTLLLGGDPQQQPAETYAAWAKALELPQVRGLVVGRALLYPADGDVVSAVDIAADIVHGVNR